MVQFIANKNDKLIPFMSSKSLCSFQRPLSEAMNWLKLYSLKGQQNACVLGAGGGYHIRYLHLMNPNLNIQVYDFDSDLIETLEIQFKNIPQVKFFLLDPLTGLNDLQQMHQFIQEKMPVVMPFRPGWQYDEELFSKLLLKITQREAAILKNNWREMNADINMRWDSLSEEKNFLTLKNLLHASDSLSSFDEKVLHIFDEIIR